MKIEFLDLMLFIYILGCVFYTCKSIIGLGHLKNLDRVLGDRPDLRRYLRLKPILWPYYLVTEKSPLERFSEIFFKHYGEKGEIYLGSRGIRNFFNDLFKGKERYKHCSVKTVYWELCRNSPEWLDFTTMLGKKKDIYARIIYARLEEKYLLGIAWVNNAGNPNESVSRFFLDECVRMNEPEFKARLLRINPTKAQELFLENSIEVSQT
jgi:hypothetical protein